MNHGNQPLRDQAPALTKQFGSGTLGQPQMGDTTMSPRDHEKPRMRTIVRAQ